MPESPRSRHRLAAAVVTVIAAVVLSACGAEETPATTEGFTEGNPDGMNGAVLTDPYVVPDVELTATDGEPFSMTEDTTAPVTLVFFGYTHCPDICQIVMADIASTLTRLEPEQREQVGMLFVTTDPARDDEATLRAYLDRFDPTFEGLTGPLPRIIEAGKSLGIAIEKGERMPSGGYEVSHGTQIVGVLPDGTAPVVWTQGTPPEQIAEDIRVVLADGVPTGETE